MIKLFCIAIRLRQMLFAANSNQPSNTCREHPFLYPYELHTVFCSQPCTTSKYLPSFHNKTFQFVKIFSSTAEPLSCGRHHTGTTDKLRTMKKCYHKFSLGTSRADLDFDPKQGKLSRMYQTVCPNTSPFFAGFFTPPGP